MSSPLDFLSKQQLVSHGARVEGQAIKVANAPEFDRLGSRKIQLEQTKHLPIAVLLDHVDAGMSGDERVHLRGERESP